MLIWGKKYLYILLIVVIMIPGNSMGKILGNGGYLAGPELEKLTTKASLSTLKATEEMYKMIAFIEDPEKDKEDSAKNYVEKIKTHLNKSAEALKKATQLPNSEFRRMNVWLIDSNYRNYISRYNIYENHYVWQDVIRSSVHGRGRGWLQQNVTLNNNLLQITNKFIEQYTQNPLPRFVWELIRNWTEEIYRGMYLSIILTE